MNEERLVATLAECMRRCQATARPFYELSQLLVGYRNDPSWTEAEVIELQTRVIRMLTGNWKGPDKEIDASQNGGAQSRLKLAD